MEDIHLLQAHGTRAAISFSKHTEAREVERQAKGPGAVGSRGRGGCLAGFAAGDPPRSRYLMYGRAGEMALEKGLLRGNEALAGKIQKALHVWALSRAMPANQPE